MSENDYGGMTGSVSRALITSRNDGPREGDGRMLLVVLVEELKERKVKGNKSATRLKLYMPITGLSSQWPIAPGN